MCLVLEAFPDFFCIDSHSLIFGTFPGDDLYGLSNRKYLLFTFLRNAHRVSIFEIEQTESLRNYTLLLCSVGEDAKELADKLYQALLAGHGHWGDDARHALGLETECVSHRRGGNPARHAMTIAKHVRRMI